MSCESHFSQLATLLVTNDAVNTDITTSTTLPCSVAGIEAELCQS